MRIDAATRNRFHEYDIAATLEILDVDPQLGLSAEEAELRLRVYGENRLQRAKRTSVLSLLRDQFRSVIVWLLAAAALLSLLASDYPEAIAILGVLAINTAIGFFTSWKALQSMEALFRLTEFTARLRRDERSVMLPSAKVTPGDVVILEAGDVVPADLRLIQVENLQCDESALTGESTPVSKALDVLHADTLVADRTNLAFKGTAVTRGAGIGVVALIGNETELGRIAHLAQTASAAANPLEKRLDKLGEALVVLTIALSVLIGFIGILRGLGLVEMIDTAIALAVAAVPEGLPVVATLALARGMLRLARRNTLVERLSAVETLGATTLILTDKTGTLTENRMTVAGVVLNDRELTRQDFTKNAAMEPDLRLALEIGALCNTAELNDSGNAGIGDPMELALLQIASLMGVRPDLDPEDRPEVNKHPYDPAFKMMATKHSADGCIFFAVKGAPEAILDSAIEVLTVTGPQSLTQAKRQKWFERIEAAAGAGYRLIGLAYKYGNSIEEPAFERLVLVGLIKLLDPLRPDVPAAISACMSAGVRVVMMTGDHLATATEIAAQAGLGTNGRVVSLSESSLQELKSDTVSRELTARLAEANVFARVTPETKLRLVQYYQDQGEVVAVTGDGVNDAPALKQSDIGIAMGHRGTQVARDAADVVLKDDSFASIVVAIFQGRVIFGNIRRFVIYLMSCNFSEILIVGLAIAAGLPAPLTPLQILFLNIVTDVFPAFALGLGEGSQNAMRRPPRDPKEPIVGRFQWTDIMVFGLLITIATLGAFWLALTHLAMPLNEAVTVAFLTLALAQLWHVFNMRDREEGLLNNSVSKNVWVFSALLFCLALLAGAFLLPAAAEVLQLSSLALEGLAVSAAASFFPLLAGALWLGLSSRLRV